MAEVRSSRKRTAEESVDAVPGRSSTSLSSVVALTSSASAPPSSLSSPPTAIVGTQPTRAASDDDAARAVAQRPSPSRASSSSSSTASSSSSTSFLSARPMPPMDSPFFRSSALSTLPPATGSAGMSSPSPHVDSLFSRASVASSSPASSPAASGSTTPSASPSSSSTPASSSRVTLATLSAPMAVPVPVGPPQRSMSTKALLHLAHPVNPSTVVVTPSLSSQFPLPLGVPSSSSALTRLRPPPISVRAHYLSEHMVGECKRRSPALHDMVIDDQFVARGVIEVVENELKNAIHIITVRRRHLNAFRALEGILYFLRFSNSAWIECAERALLQDLLFLFDACWLATLEGLQSKRQLSAHHVTNIREVLEQLLIFVREMERWQAHDQAEARNQHVLHGGAPHLAGAALPQRVADRPDPAHALGPSIAALLTAEECARLDVKRLEVMSMRERQRAVEERAKLQLSDRLARWMEQHHGMGGTAFDLTHWSYEQRYPYLLSTKTKASAADASGAAGAPASATVLRSPQQVESAADGNANEVGVPLVSVFTSPTPVSATATSMAPTSAVAGGRAPITARLSTAIAAAPALPTSDPLSINPVGTVQPSFTAAQPPPTTSDWTGSEGGAGRVPPSSSDYRLQSTSMSSSFLYAPSAVLSSSAPPPPPPPQSAMGPPSCFYSPQIVQTQSGPGLLSTYTMFQDGAAAPQSLPPPPPAPSPWSQPMSFNPAMYMHMQQAQQLQQQQQQQRQDMQALANAQAQSQKQPQLFAVQQLPPMPPHGGQAPALSLPQMSAMYPLPMMPPQSSYPPPPVNPTPFFPTGVMPPPMQPYPPSASFMPYASAPVPYSHPSAPLVFPHQSMYMPPLAPLSAPQ